MCNIASLQLVLAVITQVIMMLNYIVTLTMFNYYHGYSSPVEGSVECTFTIWSSPVRCSTKGDCLDAGLCLSKQKKMETSLECLKRWSCSMNSNGVRTLKGSMSNKYHRYYFALRCLKRMSVRFVPNSKV